MLTKGREKKIDKWRFLGTLTHGRATVGPLGRTSVWRLVVIWSTCHERWIIGTNWDRQTKPEKSELSEKTLWWWLHWNINTCTGRAHIFARWSNFAINAVRWKQRLENQENRIITYMPKKIDVLQGFISNKTRKN